MCIFSSQCRGWTCFGMPICCLILTGTVLSGQAKKEDVPIRREAKMIDAIANRNRPPKIVERSGPDIPLFPKGYDWKEQHRVSVALGKLEADLDLKLWDELVKKVDDKRYSLTVADKASNAPHNLSVGDFCYELAEWRLAGVFLRHLPDDPRKKGRSMRIIVVGRQTIKKWRQERKDKALYKLQIEVGELMLVELAKVQTVSQAEKDAARKKIEAEIKKVKESKQPTILKTRTSAFDSLYGANDAKRFRKQLGLDESGRKRGVRNRFFAGADQSEDKPTEEAHPTR